MSSSDMQRVRGEIIRKSHGYERDDGSARYIYDTQGRYLGQFQPDMLTEDFGDLGEIWLPTYDGDRCYHELTQSEMAGAS